jgi:hypothetical protein
VNLKRIYGVVDTYHSRGSTEVVIVLVRSLSADRNTRSCQDFLGSGAGTSLKNSRCVFFFENSCLSSRLQRWCWAHKKPNYSEPTLLENFKNAHTDNFVFLSFVFFSLRIFPDATTACGFWQIPKTIRQSTGREGRRRQSEI